MPFEYQRVRTTENGVKSAVAESLAGHERTRKRDKKRLKPFTVDGVGLHPKAHPSKLTVKVRLTEEPHPKLATTVITRHQQGSQQVRTQADG